MVLMGLYQVNLILPNYSITSIVKQYIFIKKFQIKFYI